MSTFPKYLNFLIMSFSLSSSLRKQNIVQDQTITRRIGMKIQIRWQISYKMPIVLGIMSSVKCPCSFPIVPWCNLASSKLYFSPSMVHLFLITVFKCCRLPHKSFNKICDSVSTCRYRITLPEKFKMLKWIHFSSMEPCRLEHLYPEYSYSSDS